MTPLPLLIDQLLEAAPPAERCPHLRTGRGACTCRSPGIPGGELYRPDPLSLQLWCLAGQQRWPSCSLWEPQAQ
jgi:hypothetical protein